MEAKRLQFDNEAFSGSEEKIKNTEVKIMFNNRN